MKTVNEIIREAGITRQSLYNAMKRAGTNVNALASEKQGNTMLFDEAAEERVKSIIEKYCQKTVNVKDQLSKAETKLRKQEEDIKRLQAEAEELRRELKEKFGNALAHRLRLHPLGKVSEMLLKGIGGHKSRCYKSKEYGKDILHLCLLFESEVAWSICTAVNAGVCSVHL